MFAAVKKLSDKFDVDFIFTIDAVEVPKEIEEIINA